MSKTTSSMKGPRCFLRVTHFVWLKPLHPETQVNLSASQPMRHVPLAAWAHSVHNELVWPFLINKQPPNSKLKNAVIYKMLLHLLICCTPHWLFLSCIKISNEQTILHHGTFYCLQETCSLDLCSMPPGTCSPLLAVFEVPSMASEAASSFQGGYPSLCWLSCLVSCCHTGWSSLVAWGSSIAVRVQTHVLFSSLVLPITAHEPVFW